MAWPIINTLLAAGILYLAFQAGALPTGVNPNDLKPAEKTASP